MQPGYEPNNILNTANYTEEQTSDILFKLNPDESTGPDKIGNTLLKKCHKTLCKSLKLIFHFFKSVFPILSGPVDLSGLSSNNMSLVCSSV